MRRADEQHGVGVVAGDGRLDESEIAALATRLGKRLNDKELKAAMEEMDDDGDGTVDCGEFEKWWTAVGHAPWSSSVRSWHLLRRVAVWEPDGHQAAAQGQDLAHADDGGHDRGGDWGGDGAGG